MLCGFRTATVLLQAQAAQRTTTRITSCRRFQSLLAAQSFFVSPTGLDSNPGTILKPFATIVHAVASARAVVGPVAVLLRTGTYYLENTIVLTPQDAHLTIQSYNGEAVEVSGAAPLPSLQWQVYNLSKGSMQIFESANDVYNMGAGVDYYGKTQTADNCSDACMARKNCTAFTWHSIHNPGDWPLKCFLRTDGFWQPETQANHTSGLKTPPRNVYVADVSHDDLKGFTGLRVNGRRGIRARFPNGDQETQLFPDGWITGGTKWTKPGSTSSARTISVTTPNRANESASFSSYEVGVGGACQGQYVPPSGYWCLDSPPRGNYKVRWPPSLTYSSGTLPRTWPSFKPNRTVINAFREGHWFSYAFLVDQYDPAHNTLGWSFGGFQGGEGADSAGEVRSKAVVTIFFQGLNLTFFVQRTQPASLLQLLPLFILPHPSSCLHAHTDLHQLTPM
eukprot:m.311430 g.311430  ORF g.311430 m.311430 type:complete len:450 (+) comp19652_c1_seq9:217-1566(+)